MKIIKNISLTIALIIITIYLTKNYNVHYTLNIGVSFLISLIVAETFYELGFPRLSSFLLIGILLGPFVLNVFDNFILNKLKFLDNVALGMIALVAGCEINFKRDFKCFLRYGKFTINQITIMSILAIPTIYLLFFIETPTYAKLPIVLFTTIIFNATSPSTTVAIIKETKSNNELSNLVLTSAIIKDITLILAFTFCLSIFAKSSQHSIYALILHEALSILTGIIIGFFINQYFKYIKYNTGTFIFLILTMTSFLADKLHLSNLLIFLIAGIVINNFSNFGKMLNELMEQNFELILLIFFFSAGASINIKALQNMLFVAVVFVLLRFFLLYLSSLAANKFIGIEKQTVKLSSFGFISQAGVSLGFAKILAENFAWGKDMSTLLFAIIGLNQIIGPILFKYSLSLYNRHYNKSSL